MPISAGRGALKWVFAWVPMVVIAIVNGAARELWYGPGLGELLAHQVSTFTAIALFGVYIWGIVRLLPPPSFRNAIAIGFLWLGMTIAFELVFGHYVVGQPWPQLLENYNLLAGRFWPLILVWVAAAPPLFYRLQH